MPGKEDIYLRRGAQTAPLSVPGQGKEQNTRSSSKEQRPRMASSSRVDAPARPET